RGRSHYRRPPGRRPDDRDPEEAGAGSAARGRDLTRQGAAQHAPPAPGHHRLSARNCRAAFAVISTQHPLRTVTLSPWVAPLRPGSTAGPDAVACRPRLVRARHVMVMFRRLSLAALLLTTGLVAGVVLTGSLQHDETVMAQPG